MVSTVKSRPNYYEMLGLTPTAASDAVAQAFARESNVLRPHAFGGIAEVCLAYQTLRDPVRRRAYDASFGLTPEPERRDPPAGPQARLPGSVSVDPVEQPAVAAQPTLAPTVTPKPRPEPLAKQAPETLEASLRRQSVDRGARDRGPAPWSQQQPRSRLEVEAGLSREPQFGGDRLRQRAFDEGLNVEVSPIGWKRTGVAVGGLVAAAVLVGALAGWWSGSDAEEPEQAKRAVSTARLPEKKLPTLAELWPAPSPHSVETRPDRPRRAAVVTPRIERTPDLPRRASADAQPREIQLEQVQADSGAGEQFAAEAAPARAAAASLPLPDRTVARTIDRIGYACGRVASTMAVEGEAPGVFKVICTSGQSYQARPVNGRYHFRRWGRN